MDATRFMEKQEEKEIEHVDTAADPWDSEVKSVDPSRNAAPTHTCHPKLVSASYPRCRGLAQERELMEAVAMAKIVANADDEKSVEKVRKLFLAIDVNDRYAAIDSRQILRGDSVIFCTLQSLKEESLGCARFAILRVK